MSTLPWGTLNDWQLLDVEERTTRHQRRLDAETARAARATQAAPVVRVRRTPQPVAQVDCAAAA